MSQLMCEANYMRHEKLLCICIWLQCGKKVEMGEF